MDLKRVEQSTLALDLPLQPSHTPHFTVQVVTTAGETQAQLATMKPTSIFAMTCAAAAAPSSTILPTLAARANTSTAGTKIILDNDWSTAGFLTYLMALDAGWNVLGLVGDTGDSWALQTSLHGLATLEVGGLASCIPVYKGADYPLVNTPELFQAWEDLHGDLPWVSSSHRREHGRRRELWLRFVCCSKVLLPVRTSPTRLSGMTRRAETLRGW